ncbi:MAG: hypothetical protein WBP46_11180 [Thiolinea sp.]
MQEPVYQTLDPHREQPTMPNYGYELIAFVTALLIVVCIGLLPTLASANLKQLPFCLVGMAFVFGALLAYHHQHHARFWVFIVAAVLITTGF